MSKLLLAVALILSLALVHQSSWAGATGLPKSPNWAFGAEIPIFKEVGVDYQGPANGPNAAIENAKILNSWGYKARPLEEIKDLLPEEFYAVLKDSKRWGNFRINEIASIPIPSRGTLYEKYLELTQRYKGSCTLNSKGSLQNYVGGCPFPGPEAVKDALKLIWNWEKRYYCDDGIGTAAISNIDAAGSARNALNEHIMLRFDNRLQIPPRPLYVPNRPYITSILGLSYLYPHAVAGTIILQYRYRDPDKDDDMWMYLPALRKVRRMSTAQRQDRLPFGMNMIWDTNEGFQGKIEQWDWRYVGKKVMFSCANASTQPQIDMKGHFTGVDNRYYRTTLYIIEGMPKKAVTMSKIRLYIDSERFQIPYAVNYDMKGRPWFFQYYGYAPDGKWFSCPINVFSLDLQRTYTTRIVLSGANFNEAKTREDFSMEALLKTYLRR